MAPLSRDDIDRRLAALHEDLGRFPSGVFCPWPLARVYNRLLEQTKMCFDDDPVLSSLASVKEHASEHEFDSSQALIGTVLGLVGQLRALLADPSP